MSSPPSSPMPMEDDDGMSSAHGSPAAGTPPPTRTRKKRANHNELERRRRMFQKTRLDDLRQAIPHLRVERPSTVLVVTKAKEYITHLLSTLRDRHMELSKFCLARGLAPPPAFNPDNYSPVSPKQLGSGRTPTPQPSSDKGSPAESTDLTARMAADLQLLQAEETALRSEIATLEQRLERHPKRQRHSPAEPSIPPIKREPRVSISSLLSDPEPADQHHHHHHHHYNFHQSAPPQVAPPQPTPSRRPSLVELSEVSVAVMAVAQAQRSGASQGLGLPQTGGDYAAIAAVLPSLPAVVPDSEVMERAAATAAAAAAAAGAAAAGTNALPNNFTFPDPEPSADPEALTAPISSSSSASGLGGIGALAGGGSSPLSRSGSPAPGSMTSGGIEDSLSSSQLVDENAFMSPFSPAALLANPALHRLQSGESKFSERKDHADRSFELLKAECHRRRGSVMNPSDVAAAGPGGALAHSIGSDVGAGINSDGLAGGPLSPPAGGSVIVRRGGLSVQASPAAMLSIPAAMGSTCGLGAAASPAAPSPPAPLASPSPAVTPSSGLSVPAPTGVASLLAASTPGLVHPESGTFHLLPQLREEGPPGGGPDISGTSASRLASSSAPHNQLPSDGVMSGPSPGSIGSGSLPGLPALGTTVLPSARLLLAGGSGSAELETSAAPGEFVAPATGMASPVAAATLVAATAPTTAAPPPARSGQVENGAIILAQFAEHARRLSCPSIQLEEECVAAAAAAAAAIAAAADSSGIVDRSGPSVLESASGSSSV
ncbi:hypothetical protein H696_00762 [Fonticula alba]|uniref:BHLH domain-containing protein n=1 Tax=Fonticula alba TaxID=691883 RepID=A0A058ZFQ3_FONAL|nr:hypothetical protein H696_00762 [Fonticula alba]KCV73220.1 hypothetical protein H696_00762 [Fonticula alba]|eukprot:XP_009492921.1 hypothetical protein H696_00762 [Fonticula alba]